MYFSQSTGFSLAVGQLHRKVDREGCTSGKLCSAWFVRLCHNSWLTVTSRSIHCAYLMTVRWVTRLCSVIHTLKHLNKRHGVTLQMPLTTDLLSLSSVAMVQVSLV